LFSHVLHRVSFYALDFYLERSKLQTATCTGKFTTTTGIICPCKLEGLKKKKRISARAILPLEPAHFDAVYHLHGFSEISAADVNVLAALSASSSSTAAAGLRV
jgi:hypothetical protein